LFLCSCDVTLPFAAVTLLFFLSLTSLLRSNSRNLACFPIAGTCWLLQAKLTSAAVSRLCCVWQAQPLAAVPCIAKTPELNTSMQQDIQMCFWPLKGSWLAKITSSELPMALS